MIENFDDLEIKILKKSAAFEQSETIYIIDNIDIHEPECVEYLFKIINIIIESTTDFEIDSPDVCKCFKNYFDMPHIQIILSISGIFLLRYILALPINREINQRQDFDEFFSIINKLMEQIDSFLNKINEKMYFNLNQYYQNGQIRVSRKSNDMKILNSLIESLIMNAEMSHEMEILINLGTNNDIKNTLIEILNYIKKIDNSELKKHFKLYFDLFQIFLISLKHSANNYKSLNKNQNFLKQVVSFTEEIKIITNEIFSIFETKVY
jgi:hypothetical protein